MHFLFPFPLTENRKIWITKRKTKKTTKRRKKIFPFLVWKAERKIYLSFSIFFQEKQQITNLVESSQKRNEKSAQTFFLSCFPSSFSTPHIKTKRIRFVRFSLHSSLWLLISVLLHSTRSSGRLFCLPSSHFSLSFDVVLSLSHTLFSFSAFATKPLSFLALSLSHFLLLLAFRAVTYFFSCRSFFSLTFIVVNENEKQQKTGEKNFWERKKGNGKTRKRVDGDGNDDGISVFHHQHTTNNQKRGRKASTCAER